MQSEEKTKQGFPIWKSIFLVFFFPFVFFMILTLYIYFTFSSSDLELVTDATPIAEEDGIIRVEYLGDPANIVPIEFEDIPQNCVDAIVAAEDRSFFQNPGYDVSGILRGIYDEFANLNYGGSSITHQLIKIGTAKYFNRTLYDKFFEAVAAVKLNNELSKPEILEMYINNVYLGNFNYGLGAAARNYLEKDSSELSLAECAYIMGLPQQPSVFQPFEDLDAGTRRQLLVLSFMLQQNMITNEEYKAAVGEELTFTKESILLNSVEME